MEDLGDFMQWERDYVFFWMFWGHSIRRERFRFGVFFLVMGSVSGRIVGGQWVRFCVHC